MKKVSDNIKDKSVERSSSGKRCALWKIEERSGLALEESPFVQHSEVSEYPDRAVKFTQTGGKMRGDSDDGPRRGCGQRPVGKIENPVAQLLRN